jgi:hypothetical protein
MTSYLSSALRTRAALEQQLRNLVPHRAVDYARMLARVADALVTDLTLAAPFGAPCFLAMTAY